jgi:hypothetical protein
LTGKAKNSEYMVSSKKTDASTPHIILGINGSGEDGLTTAEKPVKITSNSNPSGKLNRKNLR